MADTHFSVFRGQYTGQTSNPVNPLIGDEYFNTATNSLCRWSGSNWLCVQMTTTSTSSSTSTTTTTSTSTTSTSTSTSITTSTSTSTTTTI